MSFALTRQQIRERTKTVTRRMGWGFLKRGDLIRAVEKCQGLKKGETVKPLAVLRVVSVGYEPLWRITMIDIIREGFPKLYKEEFISMFCKSHKGCTRDTNVTRIEFEYVDDP